MIGPEKPVYVSPDPYLAQKLEKPKEDSALLLINNQLAAQLKNSYGFKDPGRPGVFKHLPADG